MALDEEKQRHEYEFSELMTDYKYFATQLIDQAQREEQLLKELDKEKSKSRVLSELMISEQKKYKEKLQFYEGDWTRLQLLEQQKQELEAKLFDSERGYKEVHQKYIHESQRNKLLEIEINRLKASTTVPGRKFSSGSSENSDEMVDILVSQEPVSSAETKQAKVQKVLVNADRNSSTGSPEPQLTPAPTPNSLSKVATVQKLVKQNKGTVSRTKPVSQGKSNSIGTRPSSVNKGIRETPTLNRLSSSPEESSAQSKKLPPPTPPRISSITAKSVPVAMASPDLRIARSNSLGSNASTNDGTGLQNALSPEARRRAGSDRNSGSSPNRG